MVRLEKSCASAQWHLQVSPTHCFGNCQFRTNKEGKAADANRRAKKDLDRVNGWRLLDRFHDYTIFKLLVGKRHSGHLAGKSVFR